MQKIDSLYDFLADEEGARACEAIPDLACREIPRNFFLILASQLLTRLGDIFASTKVVLPWALNTMGAPTFLIGLLVPVRESGSLLPQLAIGGQIRRFAKRKWFFVCGCLIQALSILAIALMTPELRGRIAGIMVLGAMVIFSLGRGLCSIAFKDVLGKTIPKRRRGLLSGYSTSIAGCLTLVFGIVLFLNLSGGPNQAVTMLVIASCFWFIACLSFAMVNEYEGATDGGRSALKEARKSLGLLKTDHHFRLFLMVRCLLIGAGLAAPYFVVIAESTSDDSGISKLGFFIIVSGFASMVSGKFWGEFSDADSRKVIIMTAAAVCLLCALASVFSLCSEQLPFWLWSLLFFMLSITHEGVRLGRKTYLIDMASGNRRTDYIAVGNSLVGVFLLTFGFIGALLAQVSIAVAFGLYSLMALFAVHLGKSLPSL